jgi:hypothetical protein
VTQRELAECWRLRKLNRGEARCTLWAHPLGRELRLDINGELLRSEVFRPTPDPLAWAEAATLWRAQMSEKGWEEPPAEERVGLT